MISSESLIFRSFGDPLKVLEISKVEVPKEPKEDQVLVQWIASPINPLDINKIQGAYAVRNELPAIGGSEGVGRVVKVGRNVTKFKEGDHVTTFALGTVFWTEYCIVDEEDLYKIDNRIDIAVAATFMINPPTAWIMLRDFVDLEKGDYVIQNAANSGVGRAVIELCAAWGIKTINIVRNREDVGMLKTELWKLGADHVFTEEEFAEMGKDLMKEIMHPPKLALNGVGGRSALVICSTLARGGTCVTYGGMSKKAHEFSTSGLVFNDIRIRGIAVTFWIKEGDNEEKFKKCFEELQNLAVIGKLTAPPMDRVRFTDHKEAIRKTMKGRNKKQLFIINESYRQNSKI
ncbi:hypothetical protein WR25_24395 [Diploscapter pachys]|uniref:Enoyl-[acyl-carrier-protein] reductase, mitochondrial n=1 Tax=Diploscapter pachys TaxID=2018661 RepID=A0A2A2LTC9_9BILA|nr:hypothetical protein WR25_24395 [Diploscapter pachys]